MKGLNHSILHLGPPTTLSQSYLLRPLQTTSRYRTGLGILSCSPYLYLHNYSKLRCQTLHTLAERKRLSSGNSSNIWRTPSNSSAYWDLYLATRPPYTSSFFEHMYTYHSRHSESFQIALDVGTGCGQAVPKLAQRFPHVIATDNNEEHIIEARRRLAHLQAPTKVQFAVCKAEDLASPSSSLALEPSSVDFIAAAECMPLLDTDVAISTFAHLLRPGGTLAMWFYGRPRFAEVEFVQTCQPLFDQILDRTFRMTVSGGGVEHQQAWKKALQGMRSWLDDVALPVGQWQDVSRHKWNTHAELPFFGDEALDFEAPGPLSRVSKVEKVTEERDDEFWGLEWSPRGVRDFVEACFPGLKERQAKDDVLQDLLRKIEEAMGGVNAVRKFTWPAVLVLAARRRKK